MKKIAIIVNKNWEAEPMLAGMCGNEFRPKSLAFPRDILPLQAGKYSSDKPRMIVQCTGSSDEGTVVQLEAKVWCIQDLMDKSVSSSSSEEKYRVLKSLIEKEKPDLIIAAGTAGYIADMSYSGCVVVGGCFFTHNGHPNNPASNWTHPSIGQIKDLNVNPKLFSIFDREFKQKAESKFLPVPVNPSSRLAVIVSPFYTAISAANITDYAEYAWADKEAVEHFRSIEKKLPIGSVETTHGVIRAASDTACIFASAITDREGHFDLEVIPGQNYVASLNMGILLGQLMNDINEKIKTDNLLF